jgi:REP element-mobilizing transposase RayT
MTDYKIPDVEDLVEGEIVHCMMYLISWPAKRSLPDKFLPLIHTTIVQFAEANNWIMHRLNIYNDQVCMVIQLDLETNPEKVISKIKKLTTKAIHEESKETKNETIWEDYFWLETTDQYSLDNPEAGD